MNNQQQYRPMGAKVSQFGFEKFYKLAGNSFARNNYSLTIDHCRRAVDIALEKKNLKQAARGYGLWIKSLLKTGDFSGVRKICCQSRSKLGNNLDSLFYEFQAAVKTNDLTSALKLGRQFVDLHNGNNGKPSGFFNETYGRINEVKQVMDQIAGEKSETKINIQSGNNNGQKKEEK